MTDTGPDSWHASAQIDMGRCECTYVAGMHRMPSHHKRVLFNSAAGLVPVCLVKEPYDMPWYQRRARATGKIADIAFSEYRTATIPASQLIL